MFKDMNEILKQARDVQARLHKIQEELARREVQGSAGGGMVAVTMNGRGEVVRVHIDAQATADVEMLEDLVAAACRDAHRQVQELAQRELGGLSGLLGGGLPGPT